MYRFILISFISIIFSLSIKYSFSQDEHEGTTIKGKFKMIRIRSYDAALDTQKIEFGYNSMRELVSQTYTDPIKDSVISKERYNYDDSGVLIESVITDGHGAITARMKYDEAENIVEFNLSSGKVELKYDTLGREIEEIVYNNEGMLLSKSFSIYENGLLKEWYEEDHEGVVEWRTTYTYSNFDKEGNWLRKVIYEDGEVDGVFIREIEYY